MTSSSTDRRLGLTSGVAIKTPVDCATTANITLSAEQTIDGVLTASSRVLVRAQTTSSENGIYDSDTGTWERSKDFDGANDIVKGTIVRVTGGTLYSDSYWAVSTANPITIGSSNITFGQTVNALSGVSAFMQTVLDDASASAARTTLGLGSAISAMGKVIYGLTYANAAGDVVNDIDIAAGGAMDATGAYFMTGAASTKRLDATWAVGSGGGGLDTGSIGNSDYYIWLIARSDTGVVDYLFSLSSTAPTMPASYDYKRLIGWFKRVGATIVLFHAYETEGGGIELNWDAPTLDVNLANTLTTARRTDAVKVPLNFSTIAHVNVSAFDVSAIFSIWVCCPDQTDAAPSYTTAPLNNGAEEATAGAVGEQMFIRTSATGTIAARATLATVDTYAVSTMGFRWGRRN